MKRDQSRVKKIFFLVLSPLTLFFLSLNSYAQLDGGFVMCKHEKAVRTLRIDLGSNQKCKAIYTKQGVDETVGASTTMADCEEVVVKIRKHLEEGNWNCRDVREARISNVVSEAQ